MRQIELEEEKEALRTELSVSWESLQAVYDINSNLRSAQNTGELLDRILTRAVAGQDGLRALLWLADDDQLTPAARKNVPPAAPRVVGQGLIGQALAGGQAVAVHGRGRIAAVPHLEAELEHAVSVAVVPVATRQGVSGVLEVWKDDGLAPIEPGLLQLLETLAFLAAVVVENDRLHSKALANDRLQRDVEIAGRIQQTLLLGHPPLDLPAARAAALSVPSLEVDGDFYDFFAYDPCLDVIVGDVMGKGIPAALLGAATKNHFLRAANYLLAAHPSRLPEPKEILTIVAAELARHLMSMGSFVTLCYARFDLRRRRLELIDCGHTKTIHWRRRSDTHAFVQGENMPLGFAEAEVYQQVSVPFESGDVFFFYSDGVTEARNARGEEYGEERLAALVGKYGELDAPELVDKVRADVTSFSDAQTFRDDLTCVAVKIQDVQATMVSQRATLEIASDLAELPRVRTFLQETCQQHYDVTVIKEDLWQLIVATTEAVSNIIIHAYKRQPDRRIRIEVELFLNRLALRLYHRGQQFEGDTTGPETLEGPREDHMGLYIIRQCVDSVKYTRTTHGEHCVLLVKTLKGRPEQPA
jgi:sigma-B regulation protein RsbU (phosphoserine phosphatase)